MTEAVLEVGGFAMFASDGARSADGDNPIQRAFRDLQVGATHRHVDVNVLIDTAQVELGGGDPGADI